MALGMATMVAEKAPASPTSQHPLSLLLDDRSLLLRWRCEAGELHQGIARSNA